MRLGYTSGQMFIEVYTFISNGFISYCLYMKGGGIKCKASDLKE